MMKIVYPDYDNCLTNVTNSILQHFKINPFHSTLKELDNILENKDYKNIVVILNDGLGNNILRRNLREDSFLVKNVYREITSVFPSTTSAATTSINNGLNPIEHNWLGWDVYVKDTNQTVTLFRNFIKDTEQLAQDYHVGHTHFSYDSVSKLINDNHEYQAYIVSPFEGVRYHLDNPLEMYSKIKELCLKDGKKYIYTYYNEPDGLMHSLGVDHPDVLKNIEFINMNIEKLCYELKDSLVIVLADHGHLNVKYEYLDHYPSIQNTLLRDVSIESRAVNFFIKKGMEEVFTQEFNKYFSDSFLLLTKQEVIDRKLFGIGKPHAEFEHSLGDFLAVAIDTVAIANHVKDKPMKANHAGLTEDEMVIPLILIDTDRIGED